MNVAADSFKKIHFAAFLMLLLMSSCVAVLCFPFTLDDAFITFHYARNFALGFPLGTWNVGEAPVEGFSSLLWTLIIGFFFRVHLSPFYFSKIVGCAFALAMPLSTYAAYRISLRKGRAEFVDPVTLGCAALLLAAYIPLYYYATTGMEATFFSFQVLLLLLLPVLTEGRIRWCAALLLSSTLVLTRPEGIIIAAVVNGFWLVTNRNRRERSQSGGSGSVALWSVASWPVAGLIGTAIAFAGISLFRIHQFHDLLPNTYYAKGAGGSLLHRLFLGARYEVRFFQLVAPFVVALAVCSYLSFRRAVARPFMQLLLILTLIYMVYVLKVGGDPDSAFPLRRHFVHIAGVLALLLGGFISITFAKAERAYTMALSVSLLTAVWILAGWGHRILEVPFEVFRANGPFTLEEPSPAWAWFSRYTSPDTLTALSGAGKEPYYVRGKYIDMLGLNDRHIAKFGFVDTHSVLQDSKSDMGYVLAREPDIIEGRIGVGQLLAGECPDIRATNRVLMLRAMRDNPIFKRDYVFIANGPYAIWDRAIFFNRDYLKRLNAPELVAIPVTQTSMYNAGCENR